MYEETGEYKNPNEEITGLAANGEGADIPDHDDPELIGSIDSTSLDVVKSYLKEYEKQIVNSSIENAIVICEDGMIYRCKGTLYGVYPDVDLGSKLKQASVTHNHPIGSNNEYSFSDADVRLFLSYDPVLLRGIDEKYIYEMTRNPLEIDENRSVFELDVFMKT